MIRILVLAVALATLAACAMPPPSTGDEVQRLATEIQTLGPDIDPEEANRAARIAYAYTAQLADAYQITDPPLIHNAKVNKGLRPRGLCWHWAEDIERRLDQERFQTLEMHRAIANADNPFRIDHSTAIISRKGENMYEGIVLDPWRYGGVLYWAPLPEDSRYDWVPREVVLEKRRQEQVARLKPLPAN
ncbi:lipoprotein, putative [Rhodobacteraceae bacterium KLH11]|nr:lipoprotein, putative [Rhodobacteraceae bacterium KLH11]